MRESINHRAHFQPVQVRRQVPLGWLPLEILPLYMGSREYEARGSGSCLSQRRQAAGRSNRPSSKAAASEDPEAYPWGTLRV